MATYFVRVRDGIPESGPTRPPDEITEQQANQMGWYRVVFNNAPHLVDANPLLQRTELDLTFDAENSVVIGNYSAVDREPDEQNQLRAARILELRKKRNRLLLQTDWTQLPNANGLTAQDKIDAEVYRQELRDMPTTQALNNIIWPIPPAAIRLQEI